MTEDDEDLVELADGGTIAGMSLDDIDRMTSRELKAALREARETNAAQQRVLADKTKNRLSFHQTGEEIPHPAAQA